MDGCTGSKQFSGNVLTFGNTLTGVHSGTWNDQYRIDFTCSYPINPVVNHEYEIKSGLVSGPVTSFGNLGFEIDFYKNQEFGEVVGGPFRVGTSLYGKGGRKMKKSMHLMNFFLNFCFHFYFHDPFLILAYALPPQ